MKMPLRTMLPGLCCLLYVVAAPVASAAGVVLVCPSGVKTKSVELDGVPPDWQPMRTPATLALVSAGFSDGPPEQMAFLKPSTTSRKGSVHQAHWRFEGAYPQGKWLVCEYEGRVVSLAQQVPAQTSRCTVSYTSGRDKDTKLTRIECE